MSNKPEQVGPYRILRSLALGGSAEVFLAQASDGREVALKLLLPFFGSETEFLQAFHSEALLTMGLQHPHIARAISVSREGEHHFIVMEYVDGPTLAKMLARGPLPIDITVTVLDAITRALYYANETLRVVHRDLTPHNIMSTSQGVVKVTDFGNAKAVLNPMRTRTGVLKGQFAYMSPEHARGQPVDARSDVFSVGLLAHQMITGKTVYDDEGERAILMRAREGKVPALGKSPLAQIVAKAVQLDPADRFKNSAEMTEALSGFARASEEALADWIRQ